MKARGFLELCISFSQSLPKTLELESAMMYVCIFSDRLLVDLEVTREKGLCNKHLCGPEFQVEIDWSTASLGIWLSADLVRLSFPELGILSTTVHRNRVGVAYMPKPDLSRQISHLDHTRPNRSLYLQTLSNRGSRERRGGRVLLTSSNAVQSELVVPLRNQRP